MPPIGGPYVEDLHEERPDPLSFILSGASVAIVLGNAGLAHLVFYRASIDGWEFVAESALMFLPNLVLGVGLSVAILTITAVYFWNKLKDR